MTLGASLDATLYEQASGGTANGAGMGIFAGKTNAGSVRRGLVQFDVAGGIPEGATITGAILTMTVSRTSSGGQVVALHRVLSEWGTAGSDAAGEEGGGTSARDGDATWVHTFSPDQMWQSPGGDFVAERSARTTVSGEGAYRWGLASELVEDVMAWLDDPSSNFGWILIGTESSNRTAKRFVSSEAGGGGPVLRVEFIMP